jgi:MYXO-CTERM domain-containing protein
MRHTPLFLLIVGACIWPSAALATHPCFVDAGPCDCCHGYDCPAVCFADASSDGRAGGGRGGSGGTAEDAGGDSTAGAGGSTSAGGSAGNAGTSNGGAGGTGGTATAGSAGSGGMTGPGTGGAGGANVSGAGDDAGCGCRVPGRPARGSWGAALLLGFALLTIRRRQRRPSSGSMPGVLAGAVSGVFSPDAAALAGADFLAPAGRLECGTANAAERAGSG